jgi:VIT1/CCC1 family predicted Fe2+/Mn2+ transporter
MPALDVMWVSFYSIGAMIVSVFILSAARKWVKNAFISFVIKLFAFLLFLIGAFLMVLVVFTWPS